MAPSYVAAPPLELALQWWNTLHGVTSAGLKVWIAAHFWTTATDASEELCHNSREIPSTPTLVS